MAFIINNDPLFSLKKKIEEDLVKRDENLCAT